MNKRSIFIFIFQSNTMPVLSLHNTYTLPSGSASYTLGLSGAPGAASYTLPSVGTATGTGLSNFLGGTGMIGLGSGLTGTSNHLTGLAANLASTTGLSGIGLTGQTCMGGVSGLTGAGLSNTLPISLSLGTNTSFTTFTNPLLSSTRVKAYDDLDLSLARHRVGSPLSPLIPPGVTGWDLDRYGLEGINPTYMHSLSRPLSRIGFDLDSKYEYFLCVIRWVFRCVDIILTNISFKRKKQQKI